MPGKDDSVLQTILENCSDPQFNVTDLAAKINCSSTYLREHAYTYYRMSIQQLIETVRLEHAVHLLATDNKCIDLVRIKAGYHHTKTFRRAFKKRLRITPQACREQLACSEDKQLAIQRIRKQLWGGRVDFDLR